MSIKILLADDHQMVRAGLRALLTHELDVQVIAEAEDGRAAVRLAAELAPDVVVMDVNMPNLSGVEATRQIRAGGDGNAPKVIALSAHTDRRLTTEMLKAGATGYVMKEAAFQELATALRFVVADQVYLSPAISDVVVGELRAGTLFGKSPFETLSAREREVLRLMAEGRATKEIARDLQVSVKTVETHRRKLMEKLNVDNVAELTKFAIREGLTSVDG